MMKWIFLAIGVACWTLTAKWITPMLFQVQVGLNGSFIGLVVGWIVAIGVGCVGVWWGLSEFFAEEVDSADHP